MEEDRTDTTMPNGAKQLYYRDGKYIYFGRYPQDKATQSYDGEVCACSNNYCKNGEEVYFKIQPIKWRILEESDGVALLLCENIIDMQNFGDGDNNYANSFIRYWLNEDFLLKAFTKEEGQLILTTNVDNSVLSTGFDVNQYTCEDTQDKVFLLSYKEAFELYGLQNIDRKKESTQYAFFMSGSDTDNEWWLRSPDDKSDFCARIVNEEGRASIQNVHIYEGVDYYPYTGIVPALRIKLID